MALAIHDDSELLLSAAAYIEAVHKAITGENTAPPPGVGECVLAEIINDPSLSDYVRRWAGVAGAQGASDWDVDPQRPPIDAVFERVRELLLRFGDEAQLPQTNERHRS
jgi:hypothetical protein